VLGGKLSEGINFSDELARCIMVFGLPFPSNQSVSIKAKMAYYDTNGPLQFKGKDYYENLCMRTLNQAIGRALRH
jgi:chromosome transmission fidelity protein 1